MSNEQRHAKAAPDLYLKRVEPGDYCYFEITKPRNPKEERIIAIKDKHFETAMHDDKGWLVKDLRVEGGSNDENSDAIKRLIEEKKLIKIKKKHYIHPNAGGTHPIVLAGLDEIKDFCPNSESDRTSSNGQKSQETGEKVLSENNPTLAPGKIRTEAEFTEKPSKPWYAKLFQGKNP